jgi:integrase
MADQEATSVPGVLKRRNRDGSTSYLAQVRVRPFKPVSRTFATLAEARDWKDAQTRELKKHGSRKSVRADVTALTLRDLIDEFRKDPQTVALRSFGTLAPLLDWWATEYAGVKVMQLGVLTLREARDRLAPGRAPATVNRYLSALRSCWNWGRAAGLVPADHVWPPRLLLPEPKGRTRSLSDAELAALLDAAKQESPTMHAAVVVSLATGVRQSELLRLQWSDVDLDRNTLRVQLSKNGETRAVYLPSAAVAVLRELKRAPVVHAKHVFLRADGSPMDKTALEYRWRRCVRPLAGLADFRWHDLRHSCASFLAASGASLLEIGHVLGHRSPSVTQRYAHLVAGKPVTGHALLDAKLTERKP